MIYIISEEKDITTNYIIEWLISKQIKHKRLNTELFTNLTYELVSKKGIVKIFGKKISSKDIIFHRRGKLNIIPYGISQYKVHSFIKSESDSIIKSLELYLKNITTYIGSFLKENQNYKITNLHYAQEAGLLDTLFASKCVIALGLVLHIVCDNE